MSHGGKKKKTGLKPTDEQRKNSAQEKPLEKAIRSHSMFRKKRLRRGRWGSAKERRNSLIYERQAPKELQGGEFFKRL